MRTQKGNLFISGGRNCRTQGTGEMDAGGFLRQSWKPPGGHSQSEMSRGLSMSHSARTSTTPVSGVWGKWGHKGEGGEEKNLKQYSRGGWRGSKARGDSPGRVQGSEGWDHLSSSLPALSEPLLSPLRNGAVVVSPRPLRTGLDGRDSVRFWLRNNHGLITFPLSLSLPIWNVGDYKKCLSHAWEHGSQASKALRALT